MNAGDLDTNQEAYATTGEEHVLELKQMPGLNSADVEAYLADREEAAKLIDPEKCEAFKHTVSVLDPYGLFDLPDEARCVAPENGSALRSGMTAP
jgi:hypothetical protein